MADRPIEQVQAEHAGAWMAIPGVVGVAVGEQDGRPCIVVMTAGPTEEIDRQIPSMIDGYPVVLRQTGQFRALGPQ